ncbi:hypothetical protein BGZ79_006103 [Entomortierella chlamydospora]|nr:hypothetical protein BGZ79_006103 [Entomortierella chlamydospora]
MTSQPLVASVCVDYLSHPLSAEHLLVCYQQITRQIAHAPQSAKDAAKSFQHQSQTLLELLGQHQNLAIPSTKERPAPVGCRSQLRRMQNALWRRSSQSSLAKDVALVHPETLNWQKECDVLWLYGPLYEVDFRKQQRLRRKHERKGSHQGEWYNQPDRLKSEPHQRVASAQIQPYNESSIGSTAAATEPTVAQVSELEPETTPETAISEISQETVHAPSLPMSLQETTSSDPVSVPEPTQQSDSAPESLDAHPPIVPDTASAPVPSDERSNAVLRPAKSALKQQGTRDQVFEELRAFTHSPQYAALTRSLADETRSTAVSCTSGTCSEPVTPGSNSSSPAFLLPIFPAPTKYHFRTYDRRRASFPKSSSHPSPLNVNVNLNMSVNMQLDNASSECSPTSVVSSKQLRFSLEVQELIFLPTSPPFRISRARPTRAYSDPAIQTATCSSFIAPSYALPSSFYQQQPNGSSISTAAAHASLSENTTTFIKVQAQDARASAKSSSNGLYLQHEDDESRPECDFNNDYHDEYSFDDYDESEYTDEEEDEFNGVGRSHRHRLSTKNAIVARRADIDERHHAHPSMLWKVYTAVTGVKELIAWYGSMVYHSSSL